MIVMIFLIIYVDHFENEEKLSSKIEEKNLRQSHCLELKREKLSRHSAATHTIKVGMSLDQLEMVTGQKGTVVGNKVISNN